ncbi:hypothetical protein FIT77_04235 [Candidatus Methylopumilus universalis]|uniref:hypothetical protein n=1 Tax=Candidatus Methylopumilus universalis TaxID=2588536 RepID=UPI0011222A1C|nr:hypothetical protein [Candidatus Methylopumilus universalis]QDC96508.1 hypothetical protein FIT77_04235 [Candidatus Methylopumilus universalis]
MNALLAKLKLSHTILLGVFVFTLFNFAYEFITKIRFSSIPWGLKGLTSFSIFSIITLLILVGIQIIVKKDYLKVFYFLALLIAALILSSSGILPLIIIFLLFISSTIAGKYFCTLMGINKNDFTHNLLSLTLGFGIYAFLINLLALTSLNYKFTYLVLLIIPIFGYFTHKKSKQMIQNYHIKKLRIPNSLEFLVVIYLFVIYFFIALLPEFGYDALSVHLSVPSYVSNYHQWGFDVEKYIWAVMPMNGDWLYTFVFLLKGEAAARLLNLSFIIVISLLLASEIRVYTKKYYLLGLAIFLSLPITYLEGTSLFVENIWAIFLLASAVCLRLQFKSPSKNYLLLSSAFLAFGLGTKLLTISFILPLILCFIFFRPSTFKLKLKNISLYAIIILALGGVPYLIAYLKTGNPVFPFYNGIFKSPYWNTLESFDNPIWKSGFNFSTLQNLTFHSEKFIEGQVGSFGWIFYVSLPITIYSIICQKERYSLFILSTVIIFISIVFYSQSYLRYIYPSIPLLILITIISLSQIDKISEKFSCLINRTLWILIALNILFLPAANAWYKDYSLILSIFKSSPNEIYKSYIPERSAIVYINNKYGKNAKVAFFSSPYTSFLEGTPYLANWYNQGFHKSISLIKNEDDCIEVIKKYGINVIILDENFNDPASIVKIIKSVSVIDTSFNNISVRILNKN